jgi:hypothetical protein
VRAILVASVIAVGSVVVVACYDDDLERRVSHLRTGDWQSERPGGTNQPFIGAGERRRRSSSVDPQRMSDRR